jgi:hypothetical protein
LPRRSYGGGELEGGTRRVPPSNRATPRHRRKRAGRFRKRPARHAQASWRAVSYWMRLSILNIGRYIEMMITPTTMPTAIIISGSMIDVSVWIAVSTSSS